MVEKQNCHDKKCFIHGHVKVRGRTLKGTVIKKDISKTATITFPRFYYLPKYERYEKRRTKLKVHNPKCIDAKIGDIVEIKETRSLSKTKHFTITKIIK
ncbi:MAG: 30S ribosomal protein S17 [Nanoarchaeota archaeon]|nr:30S ribosomal protein S17 [Nanoarchaeota archaeon]